MKIHKYSRATSRSKAYAAKVSAAGEVASNPTTTNNRATLDRDLWGNEDYGGDIDGTLHATGSLYAHRDNSNRWDSDGGQDWQKPAYKNEDGDMGGCVFAEVQMRAPQIIATSDVFLPYNSTLPTRLIPVLQGFDTTIGQHNVKINNLYAVLDGFESRVENLEEEVFGQGSAGGGGTTPGLGDAPYILLSGLISRVGEKTGEYEFQFSGYKHPLIDTLRITQDGGRLTVYLPGAVQDIGGEQYNVSPTSIVVMQASSAITDMYSIGMGNGTIPDISGGGIYWLEANTQWSRTTGRVIYIRAIDIHFAEDYNDWKSDAEAWQGTNGITSIQITVFGRINS